MCLVFAKMGKMKAQIATRSHVARHRANLKRLVARLEKKPFDHLPERSVECLNQFFAGYSIFGPPIWRDLASFEFWLMYPKVYAENLGSRWWRFIQLSSKDRCDSLDRFCRLYRQYPWYRLVEMWPRARNSFESFFVEYDAFLTNFGKRVGGLEDLFEMVSDEKGTIYRRREKLPKKVIRIPNSSMWWRSPANR